MQENTGQLPYRTTLMIVAASSALPYLGMLLFPSLLVKTFSPSSYLVFHNIAEFFSIMVSLSLFGVGWYTFDQSGDRHALFLSSAFLAIGLMDFMHTLSSAAMPAFITPNSTNKSTQFWIVTRLFAAAAFLGSAFIYPKSRSRWLTRPLLMTSAITVSGIAFIGINFFSPYLPATFVSGIGLTPFKKNSEYLVILLLLISGAAYWKRMVKTGDWSLIYYQSAFIVCVFSEALFSAYTKDFGSHNVLGHIYKIVAFYLMYKGIFATSVKGPYLQLRIANERLIDYSRKLEGMNRELQDFFFVASHHLQEPLRKIHTFGDLLSRNYHEVLGEKGRDHLGRVMGEAKRMSNLLRSLLSYARLSSETKLFEPTDLSAVLETTLRNLEPLITKTDGKVEVGTLPVIDADSNQMQQLFHNLLSNALKFCPESRKPIVRVSGQTNGKSCLVTFEDNGIGFDESYSEVILKPFQKLQSRTGKDEGMGIGLTICRKIVERHSGEMMVNSTPGEGARFVVILPLKQSRETAVF